MPSSGQMCWEYLTGYGRARALMTAVVAVTVAVRGNRRPSLPKRESDQAVDATPPDELECRVQVGLRLPDSGPKPARIVKQVPRLTDRASSPSRSTGCS